MGRLVMVIGLTALFGGWILYRLFVTRDLMQHKDTLTFGAFFLGIWGLVHWLLWA